MTLHDAIEKLLKEAKEPLATCEIADKLNINGWYKKKNGSKITPYQIHGRTKNYANVFAQNGSLISLIKHKKTDSVQSNLPKQVVILKENFSSNISLVVDVLMNEKKFKSAKNIDNSVPKCSGIYCIRVSNIDKLPKPFNHFLLERNHNIIYIGIASRNLHQRFLNQELRANGHGTFFRSIGAMLGFRPPKGSLLTKQNKRNYKFSPTDEQKIIDWINDNLVVNWAEFNGDFEKIETELIDKYRPLINLAKNPSALSILSEIRKECVQIANFKL